MIRYFLSALFLLCTTANLYATETRGLRVVATDNATSQTGEVKLYNKSYAVIIGIDIYPNLPRDRQLKNAVNDAKAVEEVLNKNYRFNNIIHLYNQDATKDRILEILTEELPAQMGDQDSLFLFWAGHGDQERGAQGKEIGYLIPYDGAVGKIRKNLTMTELRDTISTKLPAKHVFYVMDACYGGLLASTRAVDKKSRRDLSYLKEITKENVRQVLTAGGKGEEVLDGGYKGHSVFTGRLVEALETAGDFITANEIQAILREKVYSDSKAMGQGRTQTPAFGTLSGNGDYVFVPNIEQKVQDNKAEVAKMEAELKRYELQEAEAKKYQTERQQLEIEQKRKYAEARLKAEQLRQQQLIEEAKRQQDMAQERARFDVEQKQKEKELNQARIAGEHHLTLLKAELAKKKTTTAPLTEKLEIALLDVKRLNTELHDIEAVFNGELQAGKSRISTRFDVEIENIRQTMKLGKQSQARDEFESDAEFRDRIAKTQADYGGQIKTLERKKQDEITELEQKLAGEIQRQTADIRANMKLLGDKEYVVGAEYVDLVLGTYDTEDQRFPITISIKPNIMKKSMGGMVFLPVDMARKFKQQFTNGLIRPIVTLKAGSPDMVKVALSNEVDNYQMIGKFSPQDNEIDSEIKSLDAAGLELFKQEETRKCLEAERVATRSVKEKIGTIANVVSILDESYVEKVSMDTLWGKFFKKHNYSCNLLNTGNNECLADLLASPSKVSNSKLCGDSQYYIIGSLLSSLDPHSSIMSPDVYKEMKIDTKGAFGGLGIEISIKDEVLTVVSPIEDTPAFKAGIKAGDRILKIDEKFTKDLTINDAVKRMRGLKGTEVILTIMRDGFEKPKAFPIVRAIIQVKSVRFHLMDSGYGYVRIAQFQEKTDTDLSKALETMKEASNGTLNGLVLDLRNDPGGLLDQAVKVADHFVPEGQMIVYTEGRTKESKMQFTAKKGSKEPPYPIAILINGGSASASEIVAGALQDHKRATVMGTQSFGKGTVQTIIPISDESGLRLTTARYYTPNGRSIQAKGITPDVVVRSDSDLNAYLREKDLLSTERIVLFSMPKNNKESVNKEINIEKWEDRLRSDKQVIRAMEVLKLKNSNR